MIRFQSPTALFLSTKLLEAAFTAAATDIVTVTGHGFVNGDKIRVTTSGGDLPAGLVINTDYYVKKINANTFYLHSTPDLVSGTQIDVTDAGTGTHTLHLKSKVAYVKGFRHMNLSWHTANSANFTAKIQISDQEDVNFENAASATNRWTYVQNITNSDGSTVDGATGITQDSAGTDENKNFAINLDNTLLVCADITAWVAGTLDLRVSPASN